MGFYYSLYEWYNPLWNKDRKQYAVEHMHPQFKDLVRGINPPSSSAMANGTCPERIGNRRNCWLGYSTNRPSKSEVVVNDRWGKGARHKHGGY